jgi:SNF2 family DNA or RNA helicase
MINTAGHPAQAMHQRTLPEWFYARGGGNNSMPKSVDRKADKRKEPPPPSSIEKDEEDSSSSSSKKNKHQQPLDDYHRQLVAKVEQKIVKGPAPVMATDLSREQKRRYAELDRGVALLFREGHAPTRPQRDMISWMRRMAEAAGTRLASDEAFPATRGGGLLQAEQGLGKTIVTLWHCVSLILESAQRGSCACGCGKQSPKFLIVAPAAVRDVWRQQIEEHLRAPASVLRCIEYDNRKESAEARKALPSSRVVRPGKDAWDPTSFDLCVCSYTRLLMDLPDKWKDALVAVTPVTHTGRENYAKLPVLHGRLHPSTGMVRRPFASTGIYSVNWCYAFADEAHDARNITGKQSRALTCLLPCERQFWLTATARHNRDSDLVPMLLAVRDPVMMTSEFSNRMDVGERVRMWTRTVTAKQLLREDPHLVDDDPRMA